MKTAALVLLAVSSAVAAASDPVLVAHSQSGERVELFTDSGPCQFGARAAAWVSATQRIDGCWRVEGDLVAVAFFDGDSLRLPQAAFRKPQAL